MLVLPFFFLFMFALVLVPLAFWVMALVDVTRAPEAAFGPPWDNGKNPWLIGLIVALVLPMGMLVGAILWWVQGRKALRAGQVVPKPFWAPARAPYQQPYPQYPPSPEYDPQAVQRMPR